ncbi:unnamed protein product [Adineta steineri]|uniref:Uncharacterized protein n=1 Tax=Adineta steineri TaxID=433720 RepID=A0A815GMB1_9BILA|nr:unnamed protein product [Adineta steineri]CAF1356937.1 unnamed protein product [Adineta steineri]CAF3502842.1 unnamed protein product [Adineta steineri]CAF3709850.1 unnamed protein product [Adineta steineri]
MLPLLSNLENELYPSIRFRNNFYSTTTITNPLLQTPPPPPMFNYPNGQTSIQQFLNSDMLASMSRSNSQPDLTAASNTAQSSTNQLTSSKSMSVCSDDLYMDINGCNSSGVVDDLFLGIEADFIGTSDLSDLFENDYFSELDDTRSLFQQFPNPSSLLPAPQRSAPSSPKLRAKSRTNSHGRQLPTKLWSKMTSDEQTSATDDLTLIINRQLGRREQLEIIRILQPDGPQLLPHQTEFVLDFSDMNDDKHRRIKNIIKFNLIGNSGSMNDESDGYSSLSSNKSDPLHQRIEKALKLRQRKEQRQAAKEHRSGLFNAQHHQVLELTKCDEDIEVDILS